MATFTVGQKTHRLVLPQRTALESGSADNPGSGDETGAGHPIASGGGVPGGGHCRGETAGCSPAPRGVTPEPVQAEEKVRECHQPESHPFVFVLDKHDIPLQPCHSARARKLLAKGRAVVASHTPFTIRLRDRTAAESEVDGVEIGVDPGAKHTGLAVFTAQLTEHGGKERRERRGRYAVQLDHRGDQIHIKMMQRATYRRSRRTRSLRYRPPRFNNRTRPKGWLPPSLRHRVDTTVSWVKRLARLAPVRAVHVERAAFDVSAMSAGRPLEGVEYQQGALAGYETREFLFTKWGRKCVYCGTTNVPLSIDHIHPRSKLGSDRESNLTLTCGLCNQAKGNRPVHEFLAHKPKVLARILAQAKTPLRAAAAMNATRWALWRELKQRLSAHVVTEAATGGRTKWNRTRNRLPKTHTLDALAVGRLDNITAYPDRVLVVRCAGRGCYARTRPDRHGFPRLALPREKRFFGYATGDLVLAVVPAGKNTGTHVGRVAIRARGYFNITTAHGTVTDIHYRHIRLLQRGDGYGYTTRKEETRASAPA